MPSLSSGPAKPGPEDVGAPPDLAPVLQGALPHSDNGVKNNHALIFIPDHPVGWGGNLLPRSPSPALNRVGRELIKWLVAPVLFILALLSSVHADEDVRPIGWRDLAPAAEDVSSLLANLTPGQRQRLTQASIQRGLWAGMAREKLDAADLPPANAALLNEDFSDMAPLLDRLQSAQEQTRAGRRIFAVDLDGRMVRLPGYVLPLRNVGSNVQEFLLVPFVGACIHVPPPPPNQIIFVHPDRPFSTEGPFTQVWVTGRLAIEEAKRELYYVDGSATIDVGYALSAAQVEPYRPQPQDSLAPEAAKPAAQSWLGMAQYRASELLTRTLTDIRYDQSSKALLMGLMIAFAYGVIHTLGPGHGKAVVVSYFIGRRGSLVRGIGMGCRIAFFHVISAIAIVSLADFAFRQVSGAVPSDFRLIRQISYAGIVAVGTYLLLNAARAVRHRTRNELHSHSCPCAVHADHDDRRGSGLLSLAVGAVPCSGATSLLFYGLANDLLIPSIALVAAISAGMAVAMSAIGVTALYGGGLLGGRLRRRVDEPSRLALGFEVASSALVVLLGVLLLASTVAVPTGALTMWAL